MAKVFVHGQKIERRPLEGYWDLLPYRKRLYTRSNNDDGDPIRYDPTNNEKQASELIDLPTALTRNVGQNTDYQGDPRYRFKDPYHDMIKLRYKNAFYMDPVISQAIAIRTANILGKGMKTILEADPYLILGSDVEPNKALGDVINESEQKSLMDYIKKVERITEIYDKFESLITDFFVGGRSAKYMYPANTAAKQKYGFPDKTPTNIIDLEWDRLGQVKLDNDDKIDKIEYRDNAKFPVDEDTIDDDEKGYAKFLDYERMIYFTRIEPFYGRSIIQTILSVSEQNRMMNNQDLPEITKARWAKSMLFTSTTMSIEELEEFILDRAPATDSAVKGEMQAIELSTDADPSPLTALRIENVKFMLMVLDVPSFMMKMENITNRANSHAILSTWRNLTLEHDREKFRRAMFNQFYKKLIELWFRQSDEEFTMLDKDYRIGYIFNNLSVTDDESEAKVIDILQRHSIESTKESRKRMNLPPDRDEDEEEKQMREAMQKAREEQFKQPQPLNNNNNNNMPMMNANDRRARQQDQDDNA